MNFVLFLITTFIHSKNKYNFYRMVSFVVVAGSLSSGQTEGRFNSSAKEDGAKQQQQQHLHLPHPDHGKHKISRQFKKPFKKMIMGKNSICIEFKELLTVFCSYKCVLMS